MPIVKRLLVLICCGNARHKSFPTTDYDAHFFIKALAKKYPGSINLLLLNKEKYISFMKKVEGTQVNLGFIDSFKFMASSLEKLAKDLNDADKRITWKYCDEDLEKFELLTRKGVFPYEYVDTWDKLDEDHLPATKDFYSRLNDENISEEDYDHAQNVWNIFNIKSLGEYSDLYLRTDVLLLRDIFENFRRNCSSVYKLDPLHYLTAPGLTFDAMLKCLGGQLELLTDIELHFFIEMGIRGGVAQCSNRYACANNEYMGTAYDRNKDSTCLMYFDVNNLYGAAMSQYLPYGSFEWVDSLNIDVESIPNDSDVGYILEVDLEYPQELHELHKDLPLCPEHFIPPNKKISKLSTTLLPEKNYVIHYQNLKPGMKLTKVHRILKFKQAARLKPYSDLNIELRNQSHDEFAYLGQ